ncbi:hypothetical protein EMMF5_001339 [Cystobasidiomycetes sp. EMM_F5]
MRVVAYATAAGLLCASTVFAQDGATAGLSGRDVAGSINARAGDVSFRHAAFTRSQRRHNQSNAKRANIEVSRRDMDMVPGVDPTYDDDAIEVARRDMDMVPGVDPTYDDADQDQDVETSFRKRDDSTEIQVDTESQVDLIDDAYTGPFIVTPSNDEEISQDDMGAGVLERQDIVPLDVVSQAMVIRRDEEPDQDPAGTVNIDYTGANVLKRDGDELHIDWGSFDWSPNKEGEAVAGITDYQSEVIAVHDMKLAGEQIEAQLAKLQGSLSSRHARFARSQKRQYENGKVLRAGAVAKRDEEEPAPMSEEELRSHMMFMTPAEAAAGWKVKRDTDKRAIPLAALVHPDLAFETPEEVAAGLLKRDEEYSISDPVTTTNSIDLQGISV